MITVEIDDIALELETAPTLFSPEQVDEGTLAMLSFVELPENLPPKILDLGCGYGVVGLYWAKKLGGENVTLSDIDPVALQITQNNAQHNGIAGVRIIKSDGLREISERDYSLILSNPPYHTDFSVAKHFIEESFFRLAKGGKFYMVTKRRVWYRNKFISIFGGVRVEEKDGYFVFMGEKKHHLPAYKQKKGQPK